MSSISVIIPAYNSQRYLTRCVNSILEQSISICELILVDDGSTDGTSEFCDRLAAKHPLIKVIHRPNGGMSAARNTGIDAASGDLIAFIDSDDYVDKDYLEYLVRLLNEYEADAALCGMRCVNEDGSLYHFQPVYPPGERALTGKEALVMILYQEGFNVGAPARIFRRETLHDIRFREGIWFEDFEFSVRLYQRDISVALGSEQKYNYLRHKGSIMDRAGSDKRSLVLLELCAEVRENLADDPQLAQAAVFRDIMGHMLMYNLMIKHGTFPDKAKEIEKKLQASLGEIWRDPP